MKRNSFALQDRMAFFLLVAKNIKAMKLEWKLVDQRGSKFKRNKCSLVVCKKWEAKTMQSILSSILQKL